ncbi:MAG: YaaA family protein [Rickettsiales bacterium]
MPFFLLLSPAKNMRESAPYYHFCPTVPEALNEAEALIETMRGFSVADIQRLMGVSDAIAELNARRFADYDTGRLRQGGGVPALLAFNGDVYRNIATATYGADDFAFAQRKIRILSGLYGLLRPFDLILPYRLEMGLKLKTHGADNLYAFWKDKMTDLLSLAARETGAGRALNLASQEYFGAVSASRFALPTIAVHFKERTPKGLRTFGILAKRARGMMADHIVRRRIDDVDDVKSFNREGYAFAPELSSEKEWVWQR